MVGGEPPKGQKEHGPKNSSSAHQLTAAVEKLSLGQHGDKLARSCQADHKLTAAKSTSSSTAAVAPKKPLLKPKDILMSSRQKSHILAHKSKSVSASAVPQDVLTHDLLGSAGVKSVVAPPTKCRDEKRVDDITRALDQFSFKNQKACLSADDGADQLKVGSVYVCFTRSIVQTFVRSLRTATASSAARSPSPSSMPGARRSTRTL